MPTVRFCPSVVDETTISLSLSETPKELSAPYFSEFETGGPLAWLVFFGSICFFLTLNENDIEMAPDRDTHLADALRSETSLLFSR